MNSNETSLTNRLVVVLLALALSSMVLLSTVGPADATSATDRLAGSTDHCFALA